MQQVRNESKFRTCLRDDEVLVEREVSEDAAYKMASTFLWGQQQPCVKWKNMHERRSKAQLHAQLSEVACNWIPRTAQENDLQ